MRLNRLLRFNWKFGVVAASLFAVTLMPMRARAQFGLDPCCAIISSGLNSISGLLKNVVAKPLSSIQQIQQDAINFQQQVVYPVNAIKNARSLATQLTGQLSQVSQLYGLPINSANLPAPQKLEQMLFSHDPQAVSQIEQSYFAVYGSVIPPTDAPQTIRDLVDMSDAEAQAALKKAVELDALADAEIEAADQINQQIQSSAPGSAQILEVQASAWLVRANAYTQSGMAELIRVRSIDLANAGAELKLSVAGVNALRNSTGQALQRGSR